MEFSKIVMLSLLINFLVDVINREIIYHESLSYTCIREPNVTMIPFINLSVIVADSLIGTDVEDELKIILNTYLSINIHIVIPFVTDI